MKSFDSLAEWITFRKNLPAEKSMGFVPTMGCLHEGHLSLIAESKKTCDFTCVSIYVNPTQFNSKDDFEKYPSTIKMDLLKLEKEGVDFVLLPKYEELYPDDFRFKMTETETSKILCGEHRPGHFDGVLSVVLKLFHLVSPEKAFFGKKDYQQYTLIKEMANSYFLKTEVLGIETFRELDGLAMSSRNLRLSSEARAKAPNIYKHLKSGMPPKEIKESLANMGFEVDYVSDFWGRRFVAASIENVRLIDNVEI